MNVTYSHSISLKDYNTLRDSAGWQKLPERQAQKGIDHSVFLVSAIVEDKTVGMARLVTDGGCVAIILDVVVLPTYQKMGIGKTMIERIMSYIDNNLEAGELMYVCLMSAKGKESFYRKFGFEERPNEHVGAGMTKWVRK
ncbi:GNAT family N-acetyltransferase [Mobilitalea sibirica]|uniref:GNAT family N-acetyltransferase n=1 Tax=Mobilitalea sibirica TaxID=1462919 RepID=A0A8J7KTN8_9FIRM|nr:GNAT family N-acetyltransferase [Mobilitalea sibirica]MBH1941586.1 GNAT family N-acetyltransferase [Mobilitalea sibirica]